MKPAIAACVSILCVALPVAGHACASLSEQLSFYHREIPTTRELFANPVLRVNAGGIWRVSPTTDIRVSVDLNAGALIGWPHDGPKGSSAWLLPEVGYSWHGTADGHNTHLGLVGVGAGYGDFNSALVLYTPRFVAGTMAGATSIGFRHGISVHVLMTLLSLELSHQVLSTAGQVSQEVLLSLGLNVLGPFPLYRWLAH